MTSATTAKVLRVALLQGGKIVEELLHTEPRPLTLGDELSVTFFTPGLGLPSKFTLFEQREKQTLLTVPMWFQGKLSLGGGPVVSLSDLRQRGLASTVGHVSHPEHKDRKVPVVRLVLPETTRGRLQFGEHTLLFQFVTPPPTPEVEIPVFAPGRWGVDWSYSAILLMSFVAHIGLIAWFNHLGPTHSVKLTELPTYIRKRLQQAYVPVLQKVPVKPRLTVRPKKRLRPAPHTRGPRVKPRCTPSHPCRPKTPSKAATGNHSPKTREQIKQDVSGRGLLGGLQGNRMDTLFGTPDGVAIQIRNATRGLKRGSRMAAAGTAQRRGSDRGTKALRVPTNTAVPSAPTRVQKKKRKVVRIKSRLKMQKLSAESSAISTDSMIRLLRRKLRSLQYCYERQLKSNHSLRGKISIRLTINRKGRVRKIEVEENELNSAVARCIMSRMKRWLYPRPQGRMAEVVVPFHFLPGS